MAENENMTPETAPVKEEKVAKAAKKPGKAKEKKPSRIAAWFRTTRAELKKIVWTPRKAVLKNTILVLVAMVALGAVLGLLDFIFLSAIEGLGQLI